LEKSEWYRKNFELRKEDLQKKFGDTIYDAVATNKVVADEATADANVADEATADANVADEATADANVADKATADANVADKVSADANGTWRLLLDIFQISKITGLSSQDSKTFTAKIQRMNALYLQLLQILSMISVAESEKRVEQMISVAESEKRVEQMRRYGVKSPFYLLAAQEFEQSFLNAKAIDRVVFAAHVVTGQDSMFKRNDSVFKHLLPLTEMLKHSQTSQLRKNGVQIMTRKVLKKWDPKKNPRMKMFDNMFQESKTDKGLAQWKHGINQVLLKSLDFAKDSTVLPSFVSSTARPSGILDALEKSILGRLKPQNAPDTSPADIGNKMAKRLKPQNAPDTSPADIGNKMAKEWFLQQFKKQGEKGFEIKNFADLFLYVIEPEKTEPKKITKVEPKKTKPKKTTEVEPEETEGVVYFYPLTFESKVLNQMKQRALKNDDANNTGRKHPTPYSHVPILLEALQSQNYQNVENLNECPLPSLFQLDLTNQASHEQPKPFRIETTDIFQEQFWLMIIWIPNLGKYMMELLRERFETNGPTKFNEHVRNVLVDGIQRRISQAFAKYYNQLNVRNLSSSTGGANPPTDLFHRTISLVNDFEVIGKFRSFRFSTVYRDTLGLKKTVKIQSAKAKFIQAQLDETESAIFTEWSTFENEKKRNSLYSGIQMILMPVVDAFFENKSVEIDEGNSVKIDKKNYFTKLVTDAPPLLKKSVLALF